MTNRKFLSSVYEALKAHADTHNNSQITAAKVGSLIRQLYAYPMWQMHGFVSLKDMLLEMERLEYLTITTTEKDALAVDIRAAPDLAALHQEKSEEVVRPRRMRKQFWAAFAAPKQGVTAYLNKDSLQILFSAFSRPPQGKSWLAIQPVPIERQIELAREYLNSSAFRENYAINAALENSNWYVEFSRALESEQAGLGREWNRKRSSFIASRAVAWCESIGIDPETPFEISSAAYPRSAKVELGSDREADELRETILRALSQLPTESLLEIPIPAKYLLNEGSFRRGDAKS